MKADIVIRAKDNHEKTAECIRSIRENTPEDDYRIILVDDGSDPPLFETLEDPGDLYIGAPTGTGAVTATNRGLAVALLDDVPPYVAVMDNDTRIPQGDFRWLDRFVYELEEFPKTAAVGATTNHANPPQHVLLSPTTYTANWGKPPREGTKDNPPVASLVSFCCLLKKEVVKHLGFWDTRYDPGNYEDTDFAVTCRTAGYEIRVARSVYVHHDGHSTFSDDLKSLLTENKVKFVKKWGPGRLMDLGMIDPKEFLSNAK